MGTNLCSFWVYKKPLRAFVFFAEGVVGLGFQTWAPILQVISPQLWAHGIPSGRQCKCHISCQLLDSQDLVICFHFILFPCSKHINVSNLEVWLCLLYELHNHMFWSLGYGHMAQSSHSRNKFPLWPDQILRSLCPLLQMVKILKFCACAFILFVA